MKIKHSQDTILFLLHLLATFLRSLLGLILLFILNLHPSRSGSLFLCHTHTHINPIDVGCAAGWNTSVKGADASAAVCELRTECKHGELLTQTIHS